MGKYNSKELKQKLGSYYGMTVISHFKYDKTKVLDARDKTFCFYDHIEEAEALYTILHGKGDI